MGNLHVFKFCGDGGVPFNSSSNNPFRWPLVVGESVSHDGPVRMCNSGLHFSRTEEQARQYAKFDTALGLWCLTVEIDDADIHDEDGDKFVLKSGAIATVVAVQNRHLTGKDEEPTDISIGVWMLSGNATIRNVWGNATIRNVWGNATIQNVWGNATIQNVWDNATIQDVRDNATIQDVWDNATIQDVRDNATIRNVGGNATIQNVGGNATIQDVWDNATIQDVRDNATIQDVRDNATIRNVGGNATIQNVWDNATIRNVGGNATIQNVWDNATVVTFNGKIEHIIEDSEAFVVDRSGTHVAGYDAKTWNARAES